MTFSTRSQGPGVDRPRLLIIGLDGATYDILLPTMDAGLMPNLKAIADNGVRAVLNSTIPPLSGPAWTAFLTGKLAAKNGVFHYFRREAPGQSFSKSIAVVNGASIRTFTLWDWLGELGYRVISINVPMTYPPRPLNGLLITGVETPPGSQDFTYPPDLAASLSGYRIDQDYFLAERLFDWTSRPEPTRILADQIELLVSRRDTSLQLMREHDWDCFMVVFSETDRIGHYVWDQLKDALWSADALSSQIQDFFRELDRAIGQLREAAGPNTAVVVMSDHGMGPWACKQVHLADWLQRHGLTALEKGFNSRLMSVLAAAGLSKDRVVALSRRFLPASVIDRIADRTTRLQPQVSVPGSSAVAVAVYASVAGIDLVAAHESSGMHEMDQRRRLAEQIRQGVQEILDPDTGEPVIERVFLREELFVGPYMDQIPDLLLVFKPQYHASTAIGHKALVSPIRPTARAIHLRGEHRPQGVFMACGYPIRRLGVWEVPIALPDVMPTALYMLGATVPEDLDGEVKLDLFEETFVRQHPVRIVPVDKDFEARVARFPTDSHMSSEDEERLRRRLQGLGYL